MISKLYNFLVHVFCFIILFLFFGITNAFASAPSIISFTLNNQTANIAFNPNNGDQMAIAITTNVPVKFDTVAICAITDSVCSRTTAEKYFTQTSSLSTTLAKTWDGKTGGTNPNIVSAGQYQVKVTIGDGTDPEISLIALYSILVDFSLSSNPTSTQTSATTTDATSSDQSDSDNATTTASSTMQTTIITDYISTHSDPEDLSNYQVAPALSLSAGRNRIGYVDTPLLFNAGYQLLAGTISSACVFTWSFGDGLEDSGEKVSHTYKYPGNYSVVLNGDCSGTEAVSRTAVEILVPRISLVASSTGDIIVGNTGDTEINVGAWQLLSTSSSFIFPKDTIIGAGQNITLSSEDTKIHATASSTISLHDPIGKKEACVENIPQDAISEIVSATSTILQASTSTISLSKTIAPKAAPVAVRIPVQSAVIQKENISPTPTVSVPHIDNSATALLATNASSSEGFWNKLLYLPAKTFGTIFHSFYNF